MAMECINCHLTIDDDSYYCDQCGQEIKVCTGCGRPGKGKRCTFDGKVLVGVRQKSQQVNAIPEKLVSNSLGITESVATKPSLISDIQDFNNDTILLFLINHALNLRISIKDKDLVARMQGPHAVTFAQFPTVSGQRHVVFRHEPEKGWWFEDQNSSNGTKHSHRPTDWASVANARPYEAISLQDGHRLLIANVEFIIEIPKKNKQSRPTASTVRI